VRFASDALIAGVDEAGRGPLAGPVLVAAVILDGRFEWASLDDSKRVAPARRERLFVEIQARALAWSIVEIGPADVDRLNILQATLWGMQQAVAALRPKPARVLVDGNCTPRLPCPAQAIVQGDRLEPAISAASILAKVARDRIMAAMHGLYPEYGFDRHKGYPTPEHFARLEQFGPCAIHRRSFVPVRRLLQRALI
jgi:ribonuclease HII